MSRSPRPLPACLAAVVAGLALASLGTERGALGVGHEPQGEEIARGAQGPTRADRDARLARFRRHEGEALTTRDDAPARALASAIPAASTPRPSADPARAADTDEESIPPRGPALRRRLEQAVATARGSGPLRIAPAVIDRIVETGAVRIVFQLDAPRIDADLRRALSPAEQAADGVRVFPLLGSAAARVRGASLVALVESGRTSEIELDVIHQPSLVSTLPVIGADRAHARGDDGDGQLVAVLDTGVDLDHPMFADRLVEEACFSLLGHCPNGETSMVGPGAAAACVGSGCGHGTAVAGIAVGREPGDALIGVAPNARLIAIQIFSDLGDRIGAYSSDILAGLQHVLGLTAGDDVAAVNLSIGGDLYETSAACDAAGGAQRSAVDRLRAAGVVVVAATGNDGRIDRVASPGCLSNVVAVAATRDDDALTSFTNSSELVSFFAPGQAIETAARGGGRGFSSGTSMATPHVSGAIAAIREAHPTATPAEIENVLALSGVPIFDARNGVTKPRIDVGAAIDMLGTLATPPPASGSEPSGSIGGNAGSVASTAGSSGGGACGLVGLEPFLAVGALRLLRRPRERTDRRPRDARGRPPAC